MITDPSEGHQMRITVRRPDLERFIENKVRSGEYPTPDAVVEEALVRLQGEQDDGDWTVDELREAVQVGLHQLDRGEGVELKGERELEAFFDRALHGSRHLKRIFKRPPGR